MKPLPIMKNSMKSPRLACCALAGLLVACGSEGAVGGGSGQTQEPLFATSVVVFGDEGETTYLSLLNDLDEQEVDLAQSREFAGWSSTWTREGKVFVGDGEEPVITRYTIDDERAFESDGKISFLDHGALFADSLFISPNKAYVFAEDGVVWDPQAMEIVDTFELPVVEARAGGLEYSGLKTGRAAVVRGNRAYVATNWANWAEYTVSEDSAIVVIDTDKNEIIDTLRVDCPYVDVASLDDDGTIYFSNWVYSLGPTLLHGKAKACAVRIPPDEDRIDRDWSLTFADATEGREAAALRALGGGKALISVFHDERADLEVDAESVADTANWRFWTLDLKTLEASPVEDVDFNAGGFNTAHIDGRNFILVPSNDYASSTVYELLADGRAERRWETDGWAQGIAKVR